VPVFLQGQLILWKQRLLPFIGDYILERWGIYLQLTEQRRDPNRGNLFTPLPEGIGARGSVAPTPRWVRWGAAALVAGALGALGLGGVAGGLKLLRFVTRAA
jgi:hypothetical protein